MSKIISSVFKFVSPESFFQTCSILRFRSALVSLNVLSETHEGFQKTSVSHNLILFFICFFFSEGCGQINVQKDYDKLREKMVKEQIETRGIKDKNVIQVMKKVPRHLFIPEKLRYQAYDDHPVPIGEEQTISQPYIVALMTELLELKGNEKVLEIGTGSGYQSAVLAEITKNVYTIEIIDKLAKNASGILKELGYKNIKVKTGDGYLGWKEFAPYDRIIVTCAPEDIPQPLVEQLRDGGRMVIPIGNYPNQELLVVKKLKGKTEKESIIPVLFVPMTREKS